MNAHLFQIATNISSFWLITRNAVFWNNRCYNRYRSKNNFTKGQGQSSLHLQELSSKSLGFSISCCLSRVFAMLLCRWFFYKSIQSFHRSSPHPVELAQPSHFTLRLIHPVEPSFLRRVFHSTLFLNLPCLD